MAKKALKPDLTFDIQDGEYLHYSDNVNGKKYADNYFVAKEIEGPSGKSLIKIHAAYITVHSGKNLPEDYQNWPSWYVFDPSAGCLVESDGNSLPGDIREIPDLVHYHLVYNPETAVLKYDSRKIKEGSETAYSMELKLDPNYPFWNMIPFLFYTVRALNIAAGGALNYANPAFSTMALLFSYRSGKEENLELTAGNFRAVKHTVTVVKPFLFSIVGRLMKQTSVWIEDSKRKLVLKLEASNGSVYLLEEIGKR